MPAAPCTRGSMINAAVTEEYFWNCFFGVHKTGVLAFRVVQPILAPIAVRRFNLIGMKEELFINSVEEINASHAYRPYSVAVICLSE